MLKDIRKLMQEDKAVKDKETAAIDTRELLMHSKDLEDVVIGSVDGPLLPAKFDKQGRIFFPVFKKAPQ